MSGPIKTSRRLTEESMESAIHQHYLSLLNALRAIMSLTSSDICGAHQFNEDPGNVSPL